MGKSFLELLWMSCFPFNVSTTQNNWHTSPSTEAFKLKPGGVVPLPALPTCLSSSMRKGIWRAGLVQHGHVFAHSTEGHPCKGLCLRVSEGSSLVKGRSVVQPFMHRRFIKDGTGVCQAIHFFFYVERIPSGALCYGSVCLCASGREFWLKPPADGPQRSPREHGCTPTGIKREAGCRPPQPWSPLHYTRWSADPPPCSTATALIHTHTHGKTTGNQKTAGFALCHFIHW